jgi:hypothetical protein
LSHHKKKQSITWAKKLKRIFGIEIETYEQCSGAVKVIASIDKLAGKPISTAHAFRRVKHMDMSNEHPLVIQKILSQLNTKKDEVVELLPPLRFNLGLLIRSDRYLSFSEVVIFFFLCNQCAAPGALCGENF